MSAFLINGKELASKIRVELSQRVHKITAKLGRAPKLAVVLVGEDPASKVYVASKTKAAKNCGIATEDYKFDAKVSQEELNAKLTELSLKEDLDGILLQLPLPKSLDEFSALCSIDPKKDVDGLHPVNQGLMLRGAKTHLPCTPNGAIELILKAREQLGLTPDISGLHAVVVGRSILVGKPMGVLLLEKNCTVVYCHSKTKNLTEEIKRADIVVAAVGRPEMIKSSDIKQGAIVIDVGINRLEDGRLVGDVDFENAKEVASAITPVPGGCGPMTIAMLLVNTVNAAEDKI